MKHDIKEMRTFADVSEGLNIKPDTMRIALSEMLPYMKWSANGTISEAAKAALVERFSINGERKFIVTTPTPDEVVSAELRTKLNEALTKAKRLESDLRESVTKHSSEVARLKSELAKADEMLTKFDETGAKEKLLVAKLAETETALAEKVAKENGMMAKISDAVEKEKRLLAKSAELEKEFAEMSQKLVEVKERNKQLSESVENLSELQQKETSASNRVVELETENNALNAKLESLRFVFNAGQIIRDVVSGIGVLFMAFGLLFLFDFSVAGYFVSGLISFFMLQGLIELRKPENFETSSNLLIGFFFLELGSVWLHLQTLNNHFNKSADIDGEMWWVNLAVSSVVSIVCFLNAMTTRTANVEKV